MNFWLRNIIIGVVLAALAYLLLANQDLLFDEATDNISSEEQPAAEISKAEPKKAPLKKSKNAAADGLSKFYANLNGDDDSDGPKIRNNIVYLPDPKGDLAALLEARILVTRPLRQNWKGSTESRPFRLGETLFQKLTEYAEKDGLEVIWWLNRDFVIKDPFRINKNIIKTAHLVGEAVEGHFIDGISTYFCYQQRSIVLIEKPITYLNDECILLTSDY